MTTLLTTVRRDFQNSVLGTLWTLMQLHLSLGLHGYSREYQSVENNDGALSICVQVLLFEGGQLVGIELCARQYVRGQEQKYATSG